MTDHDIDALYQAAPGEFTAARNTLAKARGAAGGDIKALEKPTLPAWAVNQVYWRDRATFDALLNASAAMRQAHVQVISGRSADVPAAEEAHHTAVKAAVQAARAHIERVGEKATPATIEAITETFQALPTNDPAGRLTRPLKPMGFGALMSLGIPVVQGPTKSTVHGSQGLAGRSLGKGGSRVQGSNGQSKRELAEHAAARKDAQKVLRVAEAAEAKADAALADAKKAAAQVERELARVRDRLQFLEKQRNDSEELVRQRARELQAASNARIQAAQELGRMD